MSSRRDDNRDSRTTRIKDAICRRSFLKTSGVAVTAPAIHVALPRGVRGAPNKAVLPDLTETSATQLTTLIRNGEITSEKVVRAHIDRIKTVHEKINAVVVLNEEQAIARAQEADRALSNGGKPWGRLHGVPVTIKDEWDTRGIETTAGTLGLKGRIPAKDATAVARLKAAGAIILGKTNLPELGSAIETNNAIYGRTNNPYDLDRTPGGSSGGEAAIVASGGSPLGLGSDGAGSIRIPAHCCGLAGIKPTWGCIPMTGSVLHGPGTGSLWAAAGTLARSVEDLALSLDVLSGLDAEDPYSFPKSLRDYRKVDLSKLRIAFYLTDTFRPAKPEVQAVVTNAVSALSKTKARVEEKTPPGVGTEVFWRMMMRLLGADWKLATEQGLRELGTKTISQTFERASRFFERMISKYEPDLPSNRLDAQGEWFGFQSNMRQFLTRADANDAEAYDAIVCPAWPTVAPLHDATWKSEDGRDAMEDTVYTAYYNAAQVPAAVVRGGTSSEGLPIGIQIVAGPWREDIVLAIAHFLEQQDGNGYRPPTLL